MGWDEGSFIGRAKVACSSKAKWGINSVLFRYFSLNEPSVTSESELNVANTHLIWQQGPWKHKEIRAGLKAIGS